MSATKLIFATSAILLMAAALAASDQDSDATSASVAALKAKLENPAGLEVDEVRVTDDGVACIDYRLGNTKDSKSRGYAVVQRDEVLESSSDYERFEKAWNKHCHGPRDGMSSGE